MLSKSQFWFSWFLFFLFLLLIFISRSFGFFRLEKITSTLQFVNSFPAHLFLLGNSDFFRFIFDWFLNWFRFFQSSSTNWFLFGNDRLFTRCRFRWFNYRFNWFWYWLRCWCWCWCWFRFWSRSRSRSSGFRWKCFFNFCNCFTFCSFSSDWCSRCFFSDFGCFDWDVTCEWISKQTVWYEIKWD